jgi:hypothetical protein
MAALVPTQTSFFTRATQLDIPEDSILHSWLCLQEPAIGPYPEPDESNP